MFAQSCTFNEWVTVTIDGVIHVGTCGWMLGSCPHHFVVAALQLDSQVAFVVYTPLGAQLIRTLHGPWLLWLWLFHLPLTMVCWVQHKLMTRAAIALKAAMACMAGIGIASGGAPYGSSALLCMSLASFSMAMLACCARLASSYWLSAGCQPCCCFSGRVLRLCG